MTQTSPGGFIRTEEQAILDTEALKLRSLGWSYQKVADAIGTTKATAYNRVQRALAAIPAEAVDEFRRLEMERLDLVLNVAMDKAMSGDKGALFAVDRVISIMDRRAKLMGLDAPVKQEILTLDAVTAEIQRLEAQLGDADDVTPAAETSGTQAS